MFKVYEPTPQWILPSDHRVSTQKLRYESNKEVSSSKGIKIIADHRMFHLSEVPESSRSATPLSQSDHTLVLSFQPTKSRSFRVAPVFRHHLPCENDGDRAGPPRSPSIRCSSMAPITLNDPQSLKRTSTNAGFHAPAHSKSCLTSIHHHSLSFRPDTLGRQLGICQDNEVIQSLLSSSIVRALEAVGFHEAHPIAVESFRAEVEECERSRIHICTQSILTNRVQTWFTSLPVLGSLCYPPDAYRRSHRTFFTPLTHISSPYDH